MAIPTVVINNSTGSDTTASGAGPATALSGTLAATHTNTTVNITDAVNLSSVAVDGSAVLWVATSSGRRWSAISAISGSSGAWVVTVSTAYSTTQSGASWAIGGKRATLNGSRQLFSDAAPSNVGWTIDIQTGETLTSVLVVPAVASRLTRLLITSTSGTRPLITTATNSTNILDISSSSYLTIQSLAFSNTATTRGRAIGIPNGNASSIAIDNCTFDGFSVAIEGDNITYFQFVNGLSLTQVEIKNSISDGVKCKNELVVDHCNIHNNGGDGIQRNVSAGSGSVSITNTAITNNAGTGLHIPSGSGNSIVNIVANTFRNNTGSDIDINIDSQTLILVDNIFWGTGPYGVKSTTSVYLCLSLNNAYGGPHSTAERLNIPVGLTDITLTGDPGASSTDNALNSTAGAGVACKNVAAIAPNATALTATNIGAIQSVATFSITARIPSLIVLGV